MFVRRLIHFSRHLQPLAGGLLSVAFQVVLASLAVVMAGCGESRPTTYPVSGTIAFIDGKPLTQGTIEFELIGSQPPVTATGVIREDGSFVLGTFDVDDGAMAGDYQVCVFSEPLIGSGWERPDRIEPRKLHPRYQELKESNIRRTVKEQSNEFVIEVEYAPDGKPAS